MWELKDGVLTHSLLTRADGLRSGQEVRSGIPSGRGVNRTAGIR